MDTLSALLVICAGNSPVPGEFPAQRPVTRSFNVFFDLRLNKRLSKQSWSWWFETLPCPLWRHCNEVSLGDICYYNIRRNPGPLDSDPTHIPTAIGVHFHGSSGHALVSWVPSSGVICPSTCNDLSIWPFWTTPRDLKFLPRIRRLIGKYILKELWLQLLTENDALRRNV